MRLDRFRKAAYHSAMFKALGILAKYGVSMSMLTFVGLGVRYAGSWSPTLPADPTRQALQLKPSEPVPSPAIVRRERDETVWEVAYATDRDSDDLQFGIIDVAVPKLRARGALELEGNGETPAVRASRCKRRHPALSMNFTSIWLEGSTTPQPSA